ncbi:hypothetical protein SAMN05428977_100540 [Nitrosomonas sp. Nm166]|nr:hypothetical protein SAMN05428977_100540 [Nitrosomonas sp. Nm166]
MTEMIELVFYSVIALVAGFVVAQIITNKFFK